MSESDDGPAVILPLPPLTPNNPRSTRDLAIETGVVILVCIVPSLFSSIATLYVQQSRAPFLYQSLYSMIRSFARFALVLFIIFRSGEPPSHFGLKRFRIGLDLIGAVAIYMLVHVTSHLLWIVIIFLEQHSLLEISRYRYAAYAPPVGFGADTILALTSLSNGFAEEIVVRAYLITRFEQLFGSTSLAIFFSTLLFASYHIYQGEAGVISVAAFGLLYAAIFCIFRRYWPLAIGHALQDFIVLASAS